MRRAAATDGAAIAAVKWRTFGSAYRSILPDELLDRREVVPPVSFWVSRALMGAPSGHVLLAWGRPGELLGYVDAGPCRDDDVEASVTGEVYELYVDPSAQRLGGGRLLLGAAVTALRAGGRADVRLWVLAANHRALAFYRSQGWAADGGARREDLGTFEVDEVRFALAT
ncbi:MAG: hypothetical protein JWN46_2196 [Acidimicrobiales bacterium]|nr:hypothetical protein [Acidimicrobiales bacterium]